MKLIEAWGFAIRSIRGYRLRALLTMLGISFGIFTITFVFTLVNTMKVGLSENLSSLGNTVLFVHHWPWKDNSEDWYKYFNRDKMAYSYYERLKNNLTDIEALYFEADIRGGLVEYAGRTVSDIKTRGVTKEYVPVSGNTIAFGRDFTTYEIVSGRKVCILGYGIAEKIMGKPERALGKFVRHKGQQLKVIGVMDKAGLTLFGSSADDDLLISYHLMTRLYNIQSRRIDKVIAVKAKNFERMPMVENQVIGQMRVARGLRPGVDNDFAINKQESLMSSVNDIFGYLNTGGVFISLLSLLVGGFGIANIMFVSVKERTKEIGIQKALGGTRYFIMLQFLLESVTLCLVGGILGMLLLAGLSGIAQLVLNALDLGISIAIDPFDILLGLVLSVAIGLVSGLVPSFLAARMDPVEAMRS